MDPGTPRSSRQSQLSEDSEENDSWILNEDKHLLLNNRQRKSRSLQRVLNWRNATILLSILILGASISVWAYIIPRLRNFQCDVRPKKDNFEPDLLYSSRVTFQPHKFYGGRPSNETNEIWQRLSPPGDGIIAIPKKFTSNLPPSLPSDTDPEYNVYGVSMFHQLHCLNFLRFAYYPESITDMSSDEVVLHRDHCIDYIRQAIMCNGDTTFEFVTEVGINGMGATHQCRDFQKLFSWAYEHRSDKISGSGYTGGVLTHTPAHRNDFKEGSRD